jgi:hypothetical protein
MGLTRNLKKYAWNSLPVRIHPADIISVQLTLEEEQIIEKYGRTCFPKAFLNRSPTQFRVSKGKGKANPNCIGIRGEYAAMTILMAHPQDLGSFLMARPLKMSDMGDAIIGLTKPTIFDFKTRSRKVSDEELVKDDSYCAEMDAKFSNRKKYAYLQAFVFCTYNENTSIVNLMGWISAKDFFKYANLVPRGQQVPMGWTYGNDCCFLPYRRLRPISELEGLEYYPMTEQMTVQLQLSHWTTKTLSANIERLL